MLSYFSLNKVQTRIPYEVNDFLFRWKKIQRLVTKEGLDGLLLITGPDAADGQHTTKLINWLFLGHSGQHVYRNTYLPEMFHEMVILISKAPKIFVSPPARRHLSPFLYAIPGAQIFCPQDKDYDNREIYDVLKISEFYRMVKDLQKVGVLSEVKPIQKWTLIQSYALEQVGGTFFTMRFQVEDLTSKVENVYKNHDKYSLRSLSEITCKRMLGYLYGTTSLIPNTPSAERKNITEFQLNEPIKEAIEIQLLEYNTQSTEAAKTSVLFGQRTGDQSNHSSEAAIENNLHLTIDYADPYTQLRVCRTYFLSSGNKVFEEMVEKETPQEDTFLVDKTYSLERTVNKDHRNQYILMTLYSILVESTLEAIAGISKDYRNLNTAYAKETISQKVEAAAKQLYSQPSALRIEVQLFSYNSFGQPQKVDFKDTISFKLTPFYHILKTQIKDIPSEHSNTSLGSVIFSESFVLQEGCYMLLTRDISYLQVFDCRSTSDIHSKINPNLKFSELGEALSPGVGDCKMFMQVSASTSLKATSVPMANVSLYFHSLGLRIHSQQLGWVIVPHSNIKEVTLLNNINGYWIQLELLESTILTDFASNFVLLGLAPKAEEVFISKVLKLQNSPKFTEVNETPQQLLENDYFLQAVLGQKEMGLISHNQVVKNEFLFSYLEAKQLMILNSMKDIKISAFRSIYNKPDAPLEEKELEKPHILVINGTYAAGKNRFAQNLLRYSREHRFVSSVFSVSHENLQAKIETPAFLQMLDEFIQELNPKSRNLTIVVVPCWVSSKDFLEQASQKYHIRAVIVKINASNFYSTQNYDLTENLLAYCTPGFSQLIFLDTYGQQESYLQQITNILWNFNSYAKVYSVVNNSLSNVLARDVYSCNKYMSESEVFLRNKHAVLYELDVGFELRLVEVRIPLRLKDVVSRLIEHDGYLYSLRLLEMELEKYRKEAENSKDQLLLTLYKIKERIAIQNRRGLSMRLRCLKGNVNMVDEKEVQEVTWANMFYKAKSTKGQVLGLSILSHKYNEHELQELIEAMSEKDAFMSKMKQPLTAETLTKEQTKEVEKLNRDRYLDNGNFFDGHFFRDVEGNILKTHPQLPLLLKEFVEEENLSRHEYNQSVAKQWEDYKGSFSK